MSTSKYLSPLGFTDQSFPPGVHVCHIYSDDEERQEALLKFIGSGIMAGERTACFSDEIKEQALRELLRGYGVSYDELAARGTIVLASPGDAYFHGGVFSPERILGLLRTFHGEAMTNGYPAARVIGEMTPEVQHVPGGSRLLEYEARVSMLLRECPVTAVCQYDARRFDGGTLMDVLKAHPLMMLRGSVVHNPFFTPPEDYLRGVAPV